MKFDNRATDVLTTRPNCDICVERYDGKGQAIADAKTKQGPWGYLCPDHFASMAIGLGMGKGQIPLCGDDMDAMLIANYLS